MAVRSFVIINYLSLCATKKLVAFEKQDCYIYCCYPYFDEAFAILSLPFLRLRVIYCNFFFLDKRSERRTCIIPNTEALITKLDGLNYPCVVNVKASAIFEPFKVSKLLEMHVCMQNPSP